MARLTGPAGCFRLSGSLGTLITYSSRSGKQYARFQRPPRQPNTAAQLHSRAAFAWLQGFAKHMDFNTFVLWLETGELKGTTWRAEITKANLSTLNKQTTLAGIDLLPNLAGGVAPANVTVSPITHGLHFAVTLPPMPVGISYTFFQVCVISEQTISPIFAGRVHSAFATAPALTCSVGGLNTGQLYRVQGTLLTTTFRGFDRMGAYPSSTAAAG